MKRAKLLCASFAGVIAMMIPSNVYADTSVLSKDVQWYKKNNPWARLEEMLNEDKEQQTPQVFTQTEGVMPENAEEGEIIENITPNITEEKSPEDAEGVFNDLNSLAYVSQYYNMFPTQDEDEDEDEDENEECIVEEPIIYTPTPAGFTDQDIKTIAQVMRHEAGNQCEDGQVAVVEVILNRLHSEDFPDTVGGVVYQPHQFSYVGRSRRIQPTAEELQLVKDVINGEKSVLNDPSIQFYRNPRICIGVSASVEHNWGSLQYAGFVQDHAFYRKDSCDNFEETVIDDTEEPEEDTEDLDNEEIDIYADERLALLYLQMQEQKQDTENEEEDILMPN